MQDYAHLLRIYKDRSEDFTKDVVSLLSRDTATDAEVSELFNKVNEPAMAVDRIVEEIEDSDDDNFLEPAEALQGIYEALTEALANRIAKLRNR